MIYSIGQLSKETQCKVPTIRYYEEIGLLDKPRRSEGNQRQYTNQQCQRLHFIRHSRALGFSLEQIKQLIDLQDNKRTDCQQADKIALSHLSDIRNKIQRLQQLEGELLSMIETCHNERKDHCLILKSLSKS
jgi:DNA-binding transcriptional MerR regulator